MKGEKMSSAVHDTTAKNSNSGNNSNQSVSMVTQFVTEIIESPLNIALLVACIVLGCLIYQARKRRHQEEQELAQLQTRKLPPMKKRDFTVEELRKYDGTGSDGRLLVSVNHSVYDVTKASRHYGPEGPYGVFAGHDASRGLAKFSIKPDVISDKYDDLSDLTQQEMASVREWQEQFEAIWFVEMVVTIDLDHMFRYTEKYPRIGRLLKPTEEATDYTDDEEDESKSSLTDTREKTPATFDAREERKNQ